MCRHPMSPLPVGSIRITLDDPIVLLARKIFSRIVLLGVSKERPSPNLPHFLWFTTITESLVAIPSTSKVIPLVHGYTICCGAVCSSNTVVKSSPLRSPMHL